MSFSFLIKRLNKAEALSALVRKLLPDISNSDLSELLLGAVATRQAVVPIDTEALEGLVGGAEAQAFQEAAEPLPAEVVAINRELQVAASTLKSTPAETTRASYWQGTAAPAQWSREVLKFGSLNLFIFPRIFVLSTAFFQKLFECSGNAEVPPF